VQVTTDRWQPDVHDRVVQPDHEQAQAADGENERAACVHRGARDRTRAGIEMVPGARMSGVWMSGVQMLRVQMLRVRMLRVRG
jgi:hypothetical protein